jgi:hypothetical protein
MSDTLKAPVADPVDVELVDPHHDTFPFRTELSLCQLIEFWAGEELSPNPVRAAMARVLGERLREAPDLCEPAANPGAFRAHRPLMDAVLSIAFPPAFWDSEIGAVLVPFRLQSVYATPSFERLLMSENGILRGRLLNMDADTGLRIRVLYAYRHVLKVFYAIDLDLGAPIIFTVRDPDTGLDRHFKAVFDSRFLTVSAPYGAPALSDEARARILANPSDPELLIELLPPDRFVFRGVHVFRAAEVTDQEILSSIKRDLIDRESIVSSAAFQRLRDKLRALFRRPALDVSFGAIDGDQVFLLSGSRLQHCCLFADSMHVSRREFDGTLYGRVMESGEPVYVEDLATYPRRSPLEEQMLADGLRSLVIAPLHYQDALIGALKLYSPQPGDFTPNQALRLAEVLPLFSMAVKRSMDELNTRVQAFIKEQCTAIHPSVEWRFRQAVLHAFDAVRPGESPELEPIVFENIYPMYAASDIRGSSTQRASAIQADLLAQLELALEVVRAAHRAKDLPILDELAFRIRRHIGHLQDGLKSGDELTILSFLREQVERVFDQVASVGGDVRARIADYRAAVDPRLGFVYRRRRDFEQTITLINDTLSSYLDQEAARAQTMFPHYFEKQETDGIEWGLYVGNSLVEHGGFDLLHLRNLRLWQLMVLAGMARRAEALKARLPLPLEITHLVLVHHAPLAIRFRLDEKRFDVDGAYNVRYEVIKKRIDKALIDGTRERLTQPGRIAIIYSQPREAAEYREYIDYLAARGDLLPGVEELELETLQGVDGLRALRVAVNLEQPAPAPDALAGDQERLAGR